MKKIDLKKSINLLNKIKDRLNTKIVIDSIQISNLVRKINNKELHYENNVSEFIWNDVYNLNLEDSLFTKDNNWYGNNGREIVLKGIFTRYIEFISNNIELFFDSKDVKFVNVATDYEPCNAVGLRISISKNLRFHLYILLRSEDVLISREPVYGRNVIDKGVKTLKKQK